MRVIVAAALSLFVCGTLLCARLGFLHQQDGFLCREFSRATQGSGHQLSNRVQPQTAGPCLQRGEWAEPLFGYRRRLFECREADRGSCQKPARQSWEMWTPAIRSSSRERRCGERSSMQPGAFFKGTRRSRTSPTRTRTSLKATNCSSPTRMDHGRSPRSICTKTGSTFWKAQCPRAAPPPGLFQQSLQFLDKEGNKIRYQSIYSNGFPAPPENDLPLMQEIEACDSNH